MQTRVTEIADKTYRLSTFVPEIGPTGFTFNQFLIDDEQPLLFHTGPRAMFPLVSEAIASITPVERLRWITFGHVESDECGSMNEFLAAAPHAEVAHGVMGCMVSLNDLCDRMPVPLAGDQVLDLGSHRLRHIDTPHVPHGWEARVLFDETTNTLLAGDLFSNLGDPPPVTPTTSSAPPGRPKTCSGPRASLPAPRRRSGGWPSSRRPRSPSCTARRSPETAPPRFERSPTTTRRVSRRRRCAARSGRTREHACCP